MRILSVAAIAFCLTGAAWANETPAAGASADRAAVAAEVDADQIQRTMESIFESAFASAEDDAKAAGGEVQVAARN